MVSSDGDLDAHLFSRSSNSMHCLWYATWLALSCLFPH